MSFQTGKTFVHLSSQIKIFLMKSESFLTFKAQKDTKNIDKIVHVTSVVQP